MLVAESLYIYIVGGLKSHFHTSNPILKSSTPSFSWNHLFCAWKPRVSCKCLFQPIWRRNVGKISTKMPQQAMKSVKHKRHSCFCHAPKIGWFIEMTIPIKSHIGFPYLLGSIHISVHLLSMFLSSCWASHLPEITPSHPAETPGVSTGASMTSVLTIRSNRAYYYC